MPHVDFWYDFASPYSYPAAARISEEAGRRGVSVAWRPFLLGPIFSKKGLPTSPLKTDRVKGAYAWRDLGRICTRYGLPFAEPPGFPQNSLLAARVALALGETARPDFTVAVYRAQFGEGKTISEVAVIAGVLAALGHDAVLIDRTRDDAIKLALRHQTEHAEALEVFGAPFFITGGGEPFWGHDRMEDALDWAATKG